MDYQLHPTAELVFGIIKSVVAVGGSQIYWLLANRFSDL